ncbi:hypothetical protein [Streptomyces sp. ME18-1-4]|uniref:hypothetical protein n=1 Tax=Streptomyces sp. ME18-1-4 TaxID=3028685 RepID=UPI0029A9FCCC|nr:hypothetical protein [Streptomyces sp. ME18-1-4]MDX3248168.1 hypothetical protein [Streptomyces sp. ME18-1-4]
MILCSHGGQLRVVTCCAADAVTGKVEIRGADDDVLPAAAGRGRGRVAAGVAGGVAQVKLPADPYEKP